MLEHCQNDVIGINIEVDVMFGHEQWLKELLFFYIQWLYLI